MAGREQELFGDILYYAKQGIESFSNTGGVVSENPYEQILNELDRDEIPDTINAQTREEVIYHFADQPPPSENILGRNGLKLGENSLREEIEYLSTSYVNRRAMKKEELLYRKRVAKRVADIFNELNEL